MVAKVSKKKMTCIIYSFSGKSWTLNLSTYWLHALIFCGCSLFILFTMSVFALIYCRGQYESEVRANIQLKRELLLFQFKDRVSFPNIYMPVSLGERFSQTRDFSAEKLEVDGLLPPESSLWQDLDDSFDRVGCADYLYMHVRSLKLEQAREGVRISFELVNDGKEQSLEGFVWVYLIGKDNKDFRFISFPKGVEEVAGNFVPVNMQKGHHFKVKNYAPITITSRDLERGGQFERLVIFAANREKKMIFKEKRNVEFVINLDAALN